MKWTEEAVDVVAKVPFFVRNRVRKKVEQEAAQSRAKEVTIEHVRICQRRYLNRMEDEVKGFQLETCFGPGGCPKRAAPEAELAKKLEAMLKKRNLKKFLKQRVNGPLKFHHEFRITLSECPNACSRPQIADIGVIGARKPTIEEETACSDCEACVEVCQEDAVRLRDNMPVLNTERCVSCGQCISACPTGTIQEEKRGYRVLLGGKLGRHPRLAVELPGIYTEEEVIDIVEQCLDHYREHCVAGERFGKVLEKTDFTYLLDLRQ